MEFSGKSIDNPWQGSRADGDEGSSSVQFVNQEGREELGNP